MEKDVPPHAAGDTVAIDSGEGALHEAEEAERSRGGHASIAAEVGDEGNASPTGRSRWLGMMMGPKWGFRKTDANSLGEETISDDSFKDFSPNQPLLEGYLHKSGKIHNGVFKKRYVTVTKAYISYAVDETARHIDRISFTDIVGVAFDGVAELEDQHHVWFRTEAEFAWEREHVFEIKLKPEEFVVCTARIGHHDGRQFLFSASCAVEREKWAESIARMFKPYKQKPLQVVSGLDRIRRKVRWFYIGDKCQVFVAGLIMLNFLINICEAHFNGVKTDVIVAIFENFNVAFTVIFSIELVVNMFSTLLMEFVSDPWNHFDFVVVLVSLISLFMSDLPGAQILRLMRCFRVFRLFKRIPSLRQIIVALSASIPPMANAFALVCLVTAIYAIMSVTFFSTQDEDKFGDFFKAMFTMFQVMTGDAWSDIARDLFKGNTGDALVALFFVSFQLIVALVLVNVVIAVLLDEFSKAAEKKVRAVLVEDGDQIAKRCPLERLARDVAVYQDIEDMDNRIRLAYRQVVSGALTSKEIQKCLLTKQVKKGSGLRTNSNNKRRRMLRQMSMVNIMDGLNEETALLTYKQLRDGLKMLDYVPPIFINERHWREFVVNEGLSNVDDKIGMAGFSCFIRNAVRRYELVNLNMTMREIQQGNGSDGWNQDSIRSVVLGLKGLLADEDAYTFRDKSTSLPRAPILTATFGLNVKGKAEGDDSARILLKRLVGEVNKMHARLDAFGGDSGTGEALPKEDVELSPSVITKTSRANSKKSLVATKSITLAEKKLASFCNGEGDDRRSRFTSRENASISQEFRQKLSRQESLLPAEIESDTSGLANQPLLAASLPASARVSNRQLTQRSGMTSHDMTLSHRGVRQDEFMGQGWNFFQSHFLDKTVQSPQAVDTTDILGGIFGGVTDGLGAFGNNIVATGANIGKGIAGSGQNGTSGAAASSASPQNI